MQDSGKRLAISPALKVDPIIFEPFLGCVDPGVDRIARLGAYKMRNAARNLHNFVHRTGKTFPVPLSTCSLRIRRPKRGGGEFDTQYPILTLSDWMKSLLVGAEGHGAPEFLLGGHNLFQRGNYEAMFSKFWTRYETADPNHPVFNLSEAERATTIPMAFHGDEGRGLCKVPVLVESYQPLIPWMGEDVLNMKGLLGHATATMP